MYISPGASATVDVENLSKRLDGALAKMERTLSKAQKAVGMQIDADGRLVNAQGKLVEGLTLTQVKLGQYIDEVGTIHTANGEFVADLNRIEQQLGFYADAMGNVKNAQGEFIRLTNEAKKAAAEQAKAQAESARDLQVSQQMTRQAFSDSFKGLAGVGQQFNSLISVFAKGDGAFAQLQQQAQGIAQAFSITAQTFQGVMDIASGIKSAAQTSKQFLTGLSGVAGAASNSVGALAKETNALAPALGALGGPVGIAVAGVAAIGAGVTAAVVANNQTRNLSESFKEIEANAKKAGDSIKSIGDALKYGALQVPLNDYEKAVKRLEETAAKVEQERAKYNERVAAAELAEAYGGTMQVVSARALNNALDEQANAWADYSNEVKKLIDAARDEQRTEAEKLEEQKRAYQNILERIQADAELAKDTEAQAVINEQITRLDAKIAEAKNAAANEAEAALKKAQEDARNAAGIAQYLEDKVKPALDLNERAYNAAAKEWNERAAEFGLSSEQVNAALERYRNAVNAAQEAALAQTLKVDFNARKQPEQELNARFELLANALDDGKITADKYYAALEQLQDERARELEQVTATVKSSETIEAAERERAAALARIAQEENASRLDAANAARLVEAVNKDYAETVDKLTQAARAELATVTGVSFVKQVEPLTDYAAKVSALKDALTKGVITQAEYNAAIEQAKNATLGSFQHLAKLPGAIVKTETAQEAYNAALDEITQALKQGVIDERRAAELRKQAAEAMAERQKQERAQARGATGVDAFIAAGEKINKTARELIDDQFEKIKEAARVGIVSEQDLTRARRSRSKQLEEIERQEKQARAQEKQAARDSIRSALGVDSLMEELKSPLVKYRETMEQVAQAAKAGAVTNAERLALEEKAAADYWAAYERTAQAAESAAEKIDKTAPARSMGAGSEALYLAQVRNSTAAYQSKITNAAQQLTENAGYTLEETRNTNALLEGVLDTLAGLQTFNG